MSALKTEAVDQQEESIHADSEPEEETRRDREPEADPEREHEPEPRHERELETEQDQQPDAHIAAEDQEQPQQPEGTIVFEPSAFSLGARSSIGSLNLEGESSRSQADTIKVSVVVANVSGPNVNCFPFCRSSGTLLPHWLKVSSLWLNKFRFCKSSTRVLSRRCWNMDDKLAPHLQGALPGRPMLLHVAQHHHTTTISKAR